MALFRPKKDCPHCGRVVREPKDPAMYLCPHCSQPGPWATPPQIKAWEEWRREEQRKQAEREEAERRAQLQRQEKRRKKLEKAASLQPIEVSGFIAQKNEDVYFNMSADLAEWKKTRGRYEGGAGLRGVSIKVPGLKGVRAYAGGLSQRQYVPGEEGWMVTDSGSAVITSKRIVFKGGTRNVEWKFDKLVGMDADRSNGALLLQVTNRQKAHVLQLPDFELFEAALEAAISQHQSSD